MALPADRARDMLDRQWQEWLLGQGRRQLRSATGATGPPRRAVLAASAAAVPLLLASCKGVQSLGTPPPPPRDIQLLQQAISAEQLMVARYTAAIKDVTGPPAAGQLADVLAEHQQHLARLQSRLIEPAALTPSATPSPSAAAVTGRQAAVLRQLEQAEQAASGRLASDVTQLPPALAQLFASIAASEATHVPLLRGNAAAIAPLPATAVRAGGEGAGGAAADLTGLQAVLAAEQAASYGYGVVGAHLSGKRWITATDDWVAHQRGRDQLTAMITALGGKPVPSAVGYQLPSPVRSAAQAQALAVTLEDGVAQAYLGLVALPDPALRQLGAAAVRAAALRAQSWRGATVAFPGMPAASLSG